ncbi:MAG: trypsin-like peptidase domain-containing protein [Elusimicrobia bacterium]|nr:trypsin-like peptidase domain-containing protein [Elusimicrobiota bacterium]
MVRKTHFEETVGGRSFEVFYRDRETGQAIQKMRKGFGTAMFVADGAERFLVTAAHVAEGMSVSPSVVLVGPVGDPVDVPLRELSVGLSWVVHPAADVAVLRLKSGLDAGFDRHFIPLAHVRRQKQAPPAGQQLQVVGFLPIAGKSQPVVNGVARVSPITSLKRFDNKMPADFFIVDQPSGQGLSGAPVFAGGADVAGLVHGTLSDDTGAIASAVVPAYLIYETIRLAQRLP